MKCHWIPPWKWFGGNGSDSSCTSEGNECKPEVPFVIGHQNWTEEVTLQGWYREGWVLYSPPVLPVMGSACFPAITTLHFSRDSWGYCFLHLRKLCFVVYFPPCHILKYGYAAVSSLIWNPNFICVKYWYSQAILMKTIQRSCSFLELEKQSSHSLCQSGSCNDGKLSVFSFPDIPLQWLALYNSSWLPIYKHSFISCQSSISAPRAWLYFPNVLLRENFVG